MGPHRRAASLSSILVLAFATSAVAASPTATFDEATRHDLEGDPQRAFAMYLNAAEAGLPKAEFNVAVMLDSGRGTIPDLKQAAIWYARAAAHGDSRAAYDLGLLYESGQGVPRNSELARAWFEASKLPASNGHLRSLGTHGRLMRLDALDDKSKPDAPELIAPRAGAELDSETRGIELVWTSKAQSEPEQYYVELRSAGASSPHEIFSTITKLSSIFVKTSDIYSGYTWRVTALERNSGQYVASNWSDFRIR